MIDVQNNSANNREDLPENNIAGAECGYEVEEESKETKQKHGLQNLAAFGAALLFALGLGVSGMTDTTKVLGFLTLDSNWNPALMLVMGGAIAVHLVFYQLVKKQKHPFFSDVFHIPTRKDINFRLIGGSLLFGLGWGLGGICPGPGLVSIVSGASEVLVFVGAMILGMLLWQNIGEKLIK